MVMAGVRVYIDTNCFLQLKDFNQVRWQDLFGNIDEITLVVCQAVINELDRHKGSTNRRRRDRARSALKVIEDAASTSDMSLPIRDNAPKVNLTIWPGTPKWTDFPTLDPTSADDYLVAAAGTDGDGAMVLSHDTGPRIRARLSGVRAECPPEDWLLPPEQTDDQRKMAQLERELQASRNARPKLEILMSADENLRVDVWAVPPLGMHLADALMRHVAAEFPRKSVEASALVGRYANILDRNYMGQSEIDAYHAKYEEFESKLKSYFITLHERVSRHALAQPVPWAIANIGNVSAKNLILEIEVAGELELLADRGDASMALGAIELPEPPKPPRTNRYFDTMPFLPAHRELRRDPTRFYWLDRPAVGGAIFSRLNCGDFRPGREYSSGLLIRAVGDLPANGRLNVQVSAEHHEAVEAQREIVFETKMGTWLEPGVQELLPDLAKEAFAEMEPAMLPTW